MDEAKDSKSSLPNRIAARRSLFPEEDIARADANIVAPQKYAQNRRTEAAAEQSLHRLGRQAK